MDTLDPPKKNKLFTIITDKKIKPLFNQEKIMNKFILGIILSFFISIPAFAQEENNQLGEAPLSKRIFTPEEIQVIVKHFNDEHCKGDAPCEGHLTLISDKNPKVSVPLKEKVTVADVEKVIALLQARPGYMNFYLHQEYKPGTFHWKPDNFWNSNKSNYKYNDSGRFFFFNGGPEKDLEKPNPMRKFSESGNL